MKIKNPLWLKPYNKFTVFTCLLVGAVFALLISLGIWQLIRLQEKKSLLNQLQEAINMPPKELTANQALYSKVKVKGKFLEGNNIYLYRRHNFMGSSSAGYYLLTPFQTSSNKIIIAARGWFTEQDKAQISNIKNHGLEEEIIGLLLPSEKKLFLIPAYDMRSNIYFSLELSTVAKQLNLNIENFYLLLSSPLPGDAIDLLKPFPPLKELIHLRNNHLEYALTWFGLALGLLIICYRVVNFS